MQSLLAELDTNDFDFMGQKDLSERVERLTGRVTALENKRIPTGVSKGKWDRNFVLALAAFVVAGIGLPLMLLAWIEPHLQNDLKKDVKIEVADQLKEPLKQLGEIAGDVKEIKGKLEILDPLIREITIKRMSEVENLDSKELIPRLPELKHLATVARTERIAVSAEAVKKVGKKLVAVGTSEAWDAALDFLNYKSFLNASLPGIPSLTSAHIMGVGTHYEFVTPSKGAGPVLSASIAEVPKDQAARLDFIGVDKNPAPVGNQYLILSGGETLLDGMQMKNIAVIGVHVYYQGGPLIMQNVYFVNCTFSIDLKPTGQEFARAFLATEPAISFNASAHS